MCVCVCVSVRERERERVIMQSYCLTFFHFIVTESMCVCVFMCTYVCVCVWYAFL